MRQDRIDFVHNSERALADPTLHSSVRRAMVRFRELQRPVIGEIEEWQALREYAHRVKLHTLSQLDHYLEQLERQIVAAGGRMHWARDAADASRIITGLVRTRDDRTVVKSKSMTSEEIELNQVLEAAGCEVVETDLGEYLLQLAGDRPAHIIAPAVHQSKDAISKVLAEKLAAPVYGDAHHVARLSTDAVR